MKAMIFAAGLGTRLKPITDSIPKALVQVGGITLLEHVIAKLVMHGFDDIIINVHHHAQKITEFLRSKNNFNIHIEISDESDMLLDTGGGLKKASWFFNDGRPFLVHNVDIISDIDFENFYCSHVQSNALATIAVRNRPPQRYFLFDSGMNICGWENLNTNEKIISRSSTSPMLSLAFSGIHVISPQIFELLQETGKFSIVDVYLRLSTYHDIKGYLHDTGYWIDAGKPQSIHEAENILKRNNSINE
ncbi:MAG: nucleotidyltransferase family protein [Bacteroidota bacterium]